MLIIIASKLSWKDGSLKYHSILICFETEDVYHYTMRERRNDKIVMSCYTLCRIYLRTGLSICMHSLSLPSSLFVELVYHPFILHARLTLPPLSSRHHSFMARRCHWPVDNSWLIIYNLASNICIFIFLRVKIYSMMFVLELLFFVK